MTLDQAEEAFDRERTPSNAGNYLARLMEYEADGMIGDDTWLDGLATIRDYLLRAKP